MAENVGNDGDLPNKPPLFVEAPNSSDAVQFYKTAFGAEEVSRKEVYESPLVILRLGSTIIIISELNDHSSIKLGSLTRSLLCFETDEIDAAVQKVVEAGGVSIGDIIEVDTTCYSGRVGKVKDPYGNTWVICSPAKKAVGMGVHNNVNAQNDNSKAVTFSAMKPQLFLGPSTATDAIKFYKAAFGAEEVSRVSQPKRKAGQELPLVICAELRLGFATIIVSDLDDGYSAPIGSVTGSFFCLETVEIDAAVDKAVEAGGVSIREEITNADDNCYGGRVGKVKDPYGNTWVICSPANKAFGVDVENNVDAQNGTSKAVTFSAMKPQLLLGESKANEAVQFFKAAFGAEEVSRFTQPERKSVQEHPLVICAELRLGSTTVIVSDLNNEYFAPIKSVTGSVFRLESEEIDASVERAVRAGGLADGEIAEVDGACVGKVKDPYGNKWIICCPAKKDITEVLENVLSINAEVRDNALVLLKIFEEQNRSGYLLSLAIEISSGGRPYGSRMLAGILLRNSLPKCPCLDDNEEQEVVDEEEVLDEDIDDNEMEYLDESEVFSRAEEEINENLRLVHLWAGTDHQTRSRIKRLLLDTLGCVDDKGRMHAASQVASQLIAVISSIEIPKKAWPRLIIILCGRLTQESPGAEVRKQATLQTLTYVFRVISHVDIVQEDVKRVFDAIVKELNSSNQKPNLCIAAVRVLNSTLSILGPGFGNEEEKTAFIKMICEKGMLEDPQLQSAVLQYLLDLMRFPGVPGHYTEAIFQLMSSAADVDECLVQQTCRYVYEFCKSLKKRYLMGDADRDLSHDIWSGLLKMFLATLKKPNLSKVGTTWLSVVVRISEDPILPYIKVFVLENMPMGDALSKKAIALAYRVACEAPRSDILCDFVKGGLDSLLDDVVKDVDPHVRETIACTLDRMFVSLQSPRIGFFLFSPKTLPKVMNVLINCLQDVPHVSQKICEVISCVARTSSFMIPTKQLSELISALLKTADRSDGGDCKLRCAAYATLNEVVQWSSKEDFYVIHNILHTVILKLEEATNLLSGVSDGMEGKEDLQASLLSLLGVSIRKLSVQEIHPVADKIMSLLQLVLKDPLSDETVLRLAVELQGDLKKRSYLSDGG